MGVQFKQIADGSVGLEGSAAGDGGFIPVSLNYSVPSSLTTVFFVADRPMVVKGIRGRVIAAGTGGACTATFYKVPSGTAVASGTALHTGSFNLVGTANTSQTLTLSTTASDLAVAAGDAIGVVVTGTATTATGGWTVVMNPA